MPVLAPVMSIVFDSVIEPLLSVPESGRTGFGPESDPAIIGAAVDPNRKRHIRLVVALTAAVLLAAALIYTSFSAGSKTVQPSELVGSGSGAGSATSAGAAGSGPAPLLRGRRKRAATRACSSRIENGLTR